MFKFDYNIFPTEIFKLIQIEILDDGRLLLNNRIFSNPQEILNDLSNSSFIIHHHLNTDKIVDDLLNDKLPV